MLQPQVHDLKADSKAHPHISLILWISSRTYSVSSTEQALQPPLVSDILKYDAEPSLIHYHQKEVCNFRYSFFKFLILDL